MDPKSTKLDFMVRPGEPYIVLVKNRDGTTTELCLSLAISNVEDTGKTDPNRNNAPIHTFQVMIITESRLIDEQSIKEPKNE